MPNDKEVVILSGARTPFGKFGGSLKDLCATDLGDYEHIKSPTLAHCGTHKKAGGVMLHRERFLKGEFP